MNKTATNRPAAEDLPDFLHDEPGTATPAPASDVDPTVAEHAADSADLELPAAEPTPRARTNSRPRRNQPRNPAAPGGGLIASALGIAAIAIGGGLALWQPTAAWIERLGLAPLPLVALGAVLLVLAGLQRHLNNLARQLASNQNSAEDASFLLESLEFLVAAQQERGEPSAVAGEELQHLLLASQRQDEKLNNLTKAIKMYGKPLLEIASQCTELSAGLSQLRSGVETAASETRQALAGLVERRAANRSSDPSLEALQQQLTRLEVGLQAVAQRLDNPEAQKSLLRLEEQTRQASADLADLLRGEALQAATEKLGQQIDRACERIGDGIQQLRSGNLQGLETGVREIQREVSGVATAVAQIQATVKSGGTRAANPIQSSPTEPNQTAPNPAAATSANAAPTTAAPPNGGTAAASPAQATAEYQTGTRTTGSKNVLGAIAKLKQMKG